MAKVELIRNEDARAIQHSMYLEDLLDDSLEAGERLLEENWQLKKALKQARQDASRWRTTAIVVSLLVLLVWLPMILGR